MTPSIENLTGGSNTGFASGTAIAARSLSPHWNIQTNVDYSATTAAISHPP